MSEVGIATIAPDDTRVVAAAVAAHLQPGDVVALSGELGAGKTCFVQGAAAALGITAPVTSPTFVLLHTYPGPVPVVHGDVYRLGTLRDVLDLGEDVFAPDVITFVEWGDAITALLPDDHVEVVLTHADLASTDAPTSADVADPAAPPASAVSEVGVDEPRRIVLRGHGRHRDLPGRVAHDLSSATAHGVRVLPAGGSTSC